MKAEIDQLVEMKACSEAVAWLRSLKGTTTPQQAWDTCERADWMLWLLERTATDDDKPKLVRIACESARMVLSYYECEYPDDNRVRNCIETVERWLEGNATDEELQSARAAAGAAEAATGTAARAAWAAEAAALAAAPAAEAAAWAARAARAAARAATWAAAEAARAAAEAARAAAWAAPAAARAAAWDAEAAEAARAAEAEMHKRCACIVRQSFQDVPQLTATARRRDEPTT